MRTDFDTSSQKDRRAVIRVCLNDPCLKKGARQTYDHLREALGSDEAITLISPRCLGHCESGPNIAINDNIVTDVTPFSAVERVRQALRDPSCKANGLGQKSLDELDDVLDNITNL